MFIKRDNNMNMDFFDFSEEQLKQIREKSILECYTWWGLRYYGFSGIIITEDNQVYSYSHYERIPEKLRDNNVNYIVKNKELSKKECKMVKKFIENELLNKDFNNEIIKDAGFDVIVNYNGISKTIVNNKGMDNELLIYDKTERLMKKLLTSKRNFLFNFLTKVKKIHNNQIKLISDSSKDIHNIGECFENELLKKYGNCNQLKHFGLKILFITDTHNCLAHSEKSINYLKNLKSTDFDICITLGDISSSDFDVIKNVIPLEKLCGIVGNHDSINALELNHIKNINGQVIECKGVKIAAIMGSNKYKNGNYGMMTQDECLSLVQNMDVADILISHDKAYVWDRHDNVHDGLKGITDYIYRNHIPLHIHGHLHEECEETLKNGTKSICLYQIKLLEI